jgi:hypothetical protein
MAPFLLCWRVQHNKDERGTKMNPAFKLFQISSLVLSMNDSIKKLLGITLILIFPFYAQATEMSLPVELIYRQYQDGDVVGARAASLKLVRERIDILAGTGAPGSGLGELAAYTRKLDVLTRALRSLMFVETKNDAPNPPDLVPPVIKAYGVIDRALVLLESMTVLSDLEPIRREDWRAGDVLSSAERARHVLSWWSSICARRKTSPSEQPSSSNSRSTSRSRPL